MWPVHRGRGSDGCRNLPAAAAEVAEQEAQQREMPASDTLFPGPLFGGGGGHAIVGFLVYSRMWTAACLLPHLEVYG